MKNKDRTPEPVPEARSRTAVPGGGGLDPREWESFRELAHELLDEMIDLHRDIRRRPAWRPMPAAVDATFREPAPRRGEGAAGAVAAFRERVAPYPTGNIHPRFWGWVSGTGSPMGTVAEMLAGGLNSICGIFDDAASRVDDQVVAWMKEIMGFPADASGVVTSGGSVANLVGLAVARDAVAARLASRDVPAAGLGPLAGALRLYASEEVHSSVDKAAMLLGLGREAVQTVPVDDAYRIRVSELVKAIARDRARDRLPFAVVGTAGTVNTGAIDDLDALADLAAREGLWLHVDGAFGAAAALAPELAPALRGLERADSLAFDFHKWFYVPYEAGCVLIRDGAAHQATFRVPASYLRPPPRGVGARPASTDHRGPQLSRGFKALKVWMCLREQGTDRIGRAVARNAAQARYLADLVGAAPDLERLAPVELNVVCFRFAPADLADEGQAFLDRLNREILMHLHEEGTAVPSSTTLAGRFALRVAITNHRSRRDDFDLLVREVRRLGRELAPTMAGETA